MKRERENSLFRKPNSSNSTKHAVTVTKNAVGSQTAHRIDRDSKRDRAKTTDWSNAVCPEKERQRRSDDDLLPGIQVEAR